MIFSCPILLAKQIKDHDFLQEVSSETKPDSQLTFSTSDAGLCLRLVSTCGSPHQSRVSLSAGRCQLDIRANKPSTDAPSIADPTKVVVFVRHHQKPIVDHPLSVICQLPCFNIRPVHISPVYQSLNFWFLLQILLPLRWVTLSTAIFYGYGYNVRWMKTTRIS